MKQFKHKIQGKNTNNSGHDYIHINPMVRESERVKDKFIFWEKENIMFFPLDRNEHPQRRDITVVLVWETLVR